MKKEEAEAKLRCGDLGPIEDHLEAVATEWRLPRYAIGMCLIRMEEAAPALRAVLARAADGEALSEDESTLLFRGIYILGGGRDTEACQPLLRLLRKPDVDDLLGDAITEGLSRIVIGAFDGNVDSLFGLIADRSVDQFVREQLLDAATFLTWKGIIAGDRMRNLLQRFDDERLAEDDDQAWAGWMRSIALLGLRDMAPVVYRALEEGRAPDWVIDRRYFDEMLAEAEQRPDDTDRFEQFQIGYINDVLVALEWSDVLEPDEESEAFGEESFGGGKPGGPWRPAEPVRNPWRHVGRNDPCPCGSGKKFKKCCLANKD